MQLAGARLYSFVVTRISSGLEAIREGNPCHEGQFQGGHEAQHEGEETERHRQRKSHVRGSVLGQEGEDVHGLDQVGPSTQFLQPHCFETSIGDFQEAVPGERVPTVDPGACSCAEGAQFDRLRGGEFVDCPGEGFVRESPSHLPWSLCKHQFNAMNGCTFVQLARTLGAVNTISSGLEVQLVGGFHTGV